MAKLGGQGQSSARVGPPLGLAVHACVARPAGPLEGAVPRRRYQLPAAIGILADLDHLSSPWHVSCTHQRHG